MFIELQKPKSRAKIILFDNLSEDKPKQGILLLKKSEFNIDFLSFKKILVFEDNTFEEDIKNLIESIKKNIPKKEHKKITMIDKIYKFLNIFTKDEVDLILKHGSLMQHVLNEIDFPLKDNINYKALFKNEGDDLRLSFIKSKINMSLCPSFGKRFQDMTLYQACTSPSQCYDLFPKLHKKSFDLLNHIIKSEES